MKYGWYLLVAAIFLTSLGIGSGCSRMEYHRRWEDDSLTANDHSDTRVDGYEFEHETNEVVLLDRLGIVCSALSQTAEGMGNAAEARREAEEEGKSSYTYEAPNRSPSEYSGLDCGGYYRWGTGEGTLILDDGETEYPLGSRTSEAGLHLGIRQPLFRQDWLGYDFSIRFGLGSYGFEHEYPNTGFPEILLDDDDGKMFFRIPLHFGINIFPEWLFGFGVRGWGGLDPVQLAFAKKYPEFYNYLDYGAQAAYYLTFDPIAIGVFGGYERRNITWGDYVSQAQGFKVGMSVDLFYEEF